MKKFLLLFYSLLSFFFLSAQSIGHDSPADRSLSDAALPILQQELPDANVTAETCTVSLLCPANVSICSVSPTAVYVIDPLQINSSGDCSSFTTSYNITGNTTRSGNGTNATGNFAIGASTITWIVRDAVSGTEKARCSTVVVIKQSPTIEIQTGKFLYCNGDAGQPVTFSVTPSGTPFSWDANPNIGFGTQGTANIPAFTATNNTPILASASLTARATLNGCTKRVSQAFYVTSTPHVNSVADKIYCNGDDVPGIAFGSDVNNATFSWNAPGGSDIGLHPDHDNTNAIPPFTATNNTNASKESTVTVFPSVNQGQGVCPGPSLSFKITVHPTPVITNLPVHVTYCAGFPAGPFGFSTNPGNATVHWNSPGGPDIGLPSGGTGNVPAFTAKNTTNAPLSRTVTATPYIDSCPGPSYSFTITVNPLPKITAGNIKKCEGDNVPATNFQTNFPVQQALWEVIAGIDVGFGGVGASGNGNIPAFKAIQAGIATVRVTPPELDGCTGEPVTFTVTINPKPVIEQIAPLGPVCPNEFLVPPVIAPLHVSIPSVFTLEALDLDVGVDLVDSDIEWRLPTYVGLTTIHSKYKVTAATAEGCKGTMEFVATVWPVPIVGALPLPARVYCSGDVVPQVNLFSPAAEANITWNAIIGTNIGMPANSGGNVIPGFVANNPANVPLNVTIIARAKIADCNPGPPLIFTITVSPTPHANPINDMTVCNGSHVDPIELTANVAGTGFTWRSLLDIGFGTNSGGLPVTRIPAFTAKNFCNEPVTTTVTVTPVANDCHGEPVTFTITVNPGACMSAVQSLTYCNGEKAPAIHFGGSDISTYFHWSSTADVGFGIEGSGDIPAFAATNTGSNHPAVAIVTVTPFVNGCPGTAYKFDVQVNPSPIVDSLPDLLLRNNTLQPGITFGSNTGGADFAWTSTDNVGFGKRGNGNIGSYRTVNVSRTATVSVIATAAGCTGPARTFTITVNATGSPKQAQTIGLAPLPDTAAGSFTFPVSASASSGLPVTLTVSSVPAGIVSINNGIGTILGAGTVIIQASQAGNATYYAAPNVYRRFIVYPALRTYYRDNDGDGYGDNALTTSLLLPPFGYVPQGGDCNDNDKDIHPCAREICDGKDNDCDGQTDECLRQTWYYDKDRDGYGDDAVTFTGCAAPGSHWVTRGGDCDDDDKKVYPGAPEVCNGKDDNCNGQIDEGLNVQTWYYDGDKDGYGNDGIQQVACESPGNRWVLQGGDCDDDDKKVHPGATEVNNGKDDDCNGLIDETAVAATLKVNGMPLQADVLRPADALKATAVPNPSATQFEITVSSANTKEPITLRIYNADGRMMETRSVTAGQKLRIGGAYRPGIYLVNVVQGGGKTSLKLVKQ